MIGLLRSKLVAVVLLVVVGYLSLALWRVWQVKKESEENVAHVRAKLEQLKRENKTLEQILAYLKNPEYLARQVRAKLNYQSPDEAVAYVYPSESKTASASESLAGISEGVLETIKRWISKLF